ncbi:DUF6350 family protein [Yinghuangia sp. ASG 101]|uniref:cell division protein PerM n=1 Tax=Yinghuangia sp. ASG 101 TaxID=2896848 RepID=UPI001E4E3BCD|nr:DUF6350 family protein [Yinghuangia sp. ASG 101]UGQ14535.1 DUF6350 family protein [Yinghuangia sp. ASG 101]
MTAVPATATSATAPAPPAAPALIPPMPRLPPPAPPLSDAPAAPSPAASDRPRKRTPLRLRLRLRLHRRLRLRLRPRLPWREAAATSALLVTRFPATAARAVLAAVRSGAVAAVTAAGLGLLFAVGLFLLVVVADTFGGGGTSSGDIMRTAGQIWLAAQRVGVDVSADASQDAVRLGVVPLGVSIPVVIVLVRAGRRCSLAPVRHGGARYPTIALAACALVYAALAYIVAVASATPALRPVPGRAPVATFVAALVFGVFGAARAGAYPGLADRLPRRVADRVKPFAAPARAALASGAAGALLLAVGGAIVVLASTITHAGEIGRLADRVADGGPETLALALLCAALLPNAIVCAVAYASCAGFALGVGTTVAPGEVTVGALPALPLLGAVPEATSAAGWCTLAVPAVAGVGAGLVAARRTSAGSLWTTAGTAASGGIVTGALTAAAASMATGAAGTHRMAQIGPHVWTTAGAAAGEVAAAAVVTALVAGWRQRHRTRHPADHRAPRVPDSRQRLRAGRPTRTRRSGRADAARAQGPARPRNPRARPRAAASPSPHRRDGGGGSGP